MWGDIRIECNTKYENINCFSKGITIPNVGLYKMTIKSQDNIDTIMKHFILMDNAQMNTYIYIYFRDDSPRGHSDSGREDFTDIFGFFNCRRSVHKF